MAKSATFENDLLKLIFSGTAIANIADNASSSPLTNLWCALHSSDPGSGGNQSTNEVAYGNYGRVSVARGSGFTVTGNTVSPTANIPFPLGSSGSPVATHMSIGVASSGTTKILYSGALSPSITCGAGVTPIVTTVSTLTET